MGFGTEMTTGVNFSKYLRENPLKDGQSFLSNPLKG